MNVESEYGLSKGELDNAKNFRMEVMNKKEKEDFYRAENIRIKNNLDSAKKGYLDHFNFELEMRGKKEGQENRDVRESRIKYFDKSLDTLMILNGNDLLKPGFMDRQMDKLNNFQAMDNEQQLAYDKNLLIMLKNLELMENKPPEFGDISKEEKNRNGVHGLININQLHDKKLLHNIDKISEIDIFQGVRNNPEDRNYVEKIYRENEQEIRHFIDNYHPDDLELFYYNEIKDNELKMAEKKELKKAA